MTQRRINKGTQEIKAMMAEDAHFFTSYPSSLITRVGKLELRIPQDRNGRFCSEIFERHQRSEKALVAALTEMYVQGVSTRKVKAISEELCGHSFSASAISGFNKKLDGELGRFARRELDSDLEFFRRLVASGFFTGGRLQAYASHSQRVMPQEQRYSAADRRNSLQIKNESRRGFPSSQIFCFVNYLISIGCDR